MALIDELTNIADAIRGKTGKTEEMTLDQMATEIAGIETGGGSGGGMESGEFTNTSQWTLKFPVTSKKTHLLIYPKVFGDGTMNSERAAYLLAVDGVFQLAVTPSNKAAVSAPPSATVFGDTVITISSSVFPTNTGNYYWFAW